MSGTSNHNHFTPWAETHIAALRAFRDKGMSYGAAAIAMNAQFGTQYSRSAVIGKAHRLHLPGRVVVALIRIPRERRIGLHGNGKVLAARRARQRAMRPATFQMYAPPAPKVSVLPPTNAPIRLTDIGLFQCRYIAGDACGPETLYCGAAVEDGSWCSYHHALCLTPPPQRKHRSPFVLFAEMGR